MNWSDKMSAETVPFGGKCDECAWSRRDAWEYSWNVGVYYCATRGFYYEPITCNRFTPEKPIPETRSANTSFSD